MAKPFLCILAAAAIALGAISELRAFEPTDKNEALVYDTRLIPAPTETRYGRGIVVFNSNLRCTLLLPSDKEFALELETVRSRVLEEFAADFKFSIESVDEYVKEVESDSARTDDEKEFAKKLTEEGALFKKANGYQCLAVRDQSVASDAAPEEWIARQHDSAGSLVIAASDIAGFRDSFKTLRQLTETFSGT